jgi:hypothetical protein
MPRGVVVNNIVQQFLADSCTERMGTRSDYGHLSLYHVQKLWQLIEAVMSKESANPRDSRVVTPRLVGTIEACGVAMVKHGAELVYHEHAIIEADPGLPEQYGPGAIQPYRHCDEAKNRRQGQQKHACDQPVEDCLLKLLPIVERAPSDFENRAPPDRFQRDDTEMMSDEIGGDADINGHVPQCVTDPVYPRDIMQRDDQYNEVDFATVASRREVLQIARGITGKGISAAVDTTIIVCADDVDGTFDVIFNPLNERRAKVTIANQRDAAPEGIAEAPE